MCTHSYGPCFAVIALLTLAPLVGCGDSSRDYTATAILKIEERGGDLLFDRGDSESDPERDYARFVRTQIETLTSQPVLLSVVGDPEVGGLQHLADCEDPVSEVMSRLAIRSINGSELYEVSYQAPSPNDAQIVAIAAVNEYFKKMQNDLKARHYKLLQLLLELEEEAQGKVKHWQDRMFKLEESLEIGPRFDSMRMMTLKEIDSLLEERVLLRTMVVDADTGDDSGGAELASAALDSVSKRLDEIDSTLKELKESLWPERGARQAELEIAKTELQRHEAIHGRISERIIRLETEARTPPQISLFSNPTAYKTRDRAATAQPPSTATASR